MLQLQDIYIQYGDRVVLDRVSFTITAEDKVGLVGLNGAGKSTLLKIMAGYMQPHEGQVARPTQSKLGFLHQDLEIPQDKTVINEALSAFEELRAMERHLEALNQEVARREDYESASYMKLLEDLADTNDRFQLLGGSSMRADAERVLGGLGFMHKDLDRPITEFSGGWQMRIELAKLLLQKPDYLLLDEPTNHLDIESIIWLEDFLKSYEACVIVISHDKTFLDNVTKRTIEVELGKVYSYKAAYSRYVTLREERREKMQSAFENQQKEIAQKEKLIERFRAKANKAKMAQSLIKQLDKMERIELEQANSATMRIEFPPAPRAGEIVVEVKDVTKRYDDLLVLNEVNFQLERGERVAFVGKNGEGKSTLSKIIVGKVPAEGLVKLGHNVELAYYAQNQSDSLNPALTVLETIERAAPESMRTKLRSILGAFLFSGEAVDKKVSVLSGGERARLAMACLMLRPANLMILDEPTNHLDIRSKEVLKEAIMRYEGALIVVSHDREFLQGLTTRTVEFNQQRLTNYLGDVSFFLEKRAVDNFREVSLGKGNAPAPKAARSRTKEEQKQYDKARKKKQRQVQLAERKVTDLEEAIETLKEKMGDMSIFGTPEYDTLVEQFGQKEKELQIAMESWEASMLDLETFEEDMA